MAREPTFYDILGIPKDATLNEIRFAYRIAALRLHPDKNINSGETDLFLKIQEAYEVLSNTQRRSDYDRKLPAQPSNTQPLGVHVHYSRAGLSAINEPQLVYVLIDLAALPDEEINPSPPINACLVLDTSTSMQGELIDTVKYTAIELVRQLRTQDTLSIVSFNDRAEVILPSSSNLDMDLAVVENNIRGLRASGGTEILQGLQAGFKEIRVNYQNDFVNHIILITDGRTYGDEADCLEIAQDAVDMGVGISCMGIGDKWNVSFMEKLASITGGNCKYVSKPADINTFLKEVFSSLSQSYAKNVTYHFETCGQSDLKFAFRLQPETSALETMPPMPLGNLLYDSTLRILLEFEVSPLQPDLERITLAEGYLSMDIPTRQIPGYAIRLNLEQDVRKTEFDGPPPLVILKALSELKYYRMQEMARKDIRTGNYNSAARRLEHLASQLMDKGERDLANTVLFEAEQVKKNKPLSEEGEKRIKYGTRALMLPEPSK